MESHDDYASFHGSVAQFQHVLAEICVIEIYLSSRHSFQDNNLIYSAMSEANFNPITMFYTLLEIYFDCASFGGGLAKFQFVLA
jgi:hypothetical protein